MGTKDRDNLKRSLGLAEEILRLSEEGMADCRDDGCLVVYGIIRDCAYRIRASAEEELGAHGRATAGVRAGSGRRVGKRQRKEEKPR